MGFVLFEDRPLDCQSCDGIQRLWYVVMQGMQEIITELCKITSFPFPYFPSKIINDLLDFGSDGCLGADNRATSMWRQSPGPSSYLRMEANSI